MIKSCSLRFDRTLTPEQCAFSLRDAGFTHVFCTWGYSDEDLSCIDASRAAGLTIETIHAAFGGCNDMWVDDLRGESRMEFFVDTVRACARFDVPTMILHLSAGDTPPPMNEIGLRRYTRVCKEAERLGINVAFENLRKTDYLRYIFAHLDSPARKFCYDSGHENLYDHGKGVLEEFARDLVAVHLHDNFGTHDDHVLPFAGTIDWQKLCKRLKNVSFSLPITLELKASGIGVDYAQQAFDAACKIEQLLQS